MQSQRVGEPNAIQFLTIHADPYQGPRNSNEIRRQHARRELDKLGMVVPLSAHLLYASGEPRACKVNIWEDGHAYGPDVDAWHVEQGDDRVDVAARKGFGVESLQRRTYRGAWRVSCDGRVVAHWTRAV